jgi:DinB superfamily
MVSVTTERTDRLAETPRALAHLVAELTDAGMDRPAAPADWSPRIILAHLRDHEFLCLRVCLERALVEDTPVTRCGDGATWLQRRNRSRDRKEWLLADFALQRQAGISILRALRPEDWERTLDAEARGVITLSRHLDTWLRHDAEHVAQLERAVGETLDDIRARRSRLADSQR